ncbi:MAG: hypothetical protein AAF841_04855 [Pseudomonadota bacterium]
MRRDLGFRALAGAAALCLVAACEMPRAAKSTGAVAEPDYLSIETRRLDDELVTFTLTLRNAPGDDPIRAYGDCAAAQYARIRGFSFARHVRTNVTRDGDIARANALYSVSAVLPRGPQTLDAEVTLANCRESGIPSI